MTYSDIKSLLNQALSTYSAERTSLMRKGRYTSGDHYADGFVAMAYETLQELKCDETLYPLGRDGARRLIYAFNRLTGEKVPDIWDTCPPVED